MQYVNYCICKCLQPNSANFIMEHCSIQWLHLSGGGVCECVGRIIEFPQPASVPGMLGA